MGRKFNITGMCKPEKHYMVDISDRLAGIEKLIGEGAYIALNRGRQYGKTTILSLLKRRLETEYAVFSISFEGLGRKPLRIPTVFPRHFAACSMMPSTMGK